jgi:hypothetical protein
VDKREAVICLDSYSDELLGLALLMRVRTVLDDDEIRLAHANVINRIVEKQKEGMLLARDILTDEDRRYGASASANDFERNAAVERFVLANEKANEALRQKGAEAIAAKVASAASPAAVNEPASQGLDPEPLSS